MKIDLEECVRRGLSVTIAPLNYPIRGPVTGVRISMAGFGWNGMLTLNHCVEGTERLEERVNEAVQEMLADRGW